MEQWEDQGLVLAARPHGESGAIVTILTRGHGRFAAYVRGAQGRKMRGILEIGNDVDVQWQSRSSDQMGFFSLELLSSNAAGLFDDRLKLMALQSACGLCDAALPDREMQIDVYNGSRALISALSGPAWGAAYVIWEVALLRVLGFALDLEKCAATGMSDHLIYVSPKTGRAVSKEAGEPYKDKLLPLPQFLIPGQGGDFDDQDIADGLRMTGYFLEHWVFTHHSFGIPTARLQFAERFASDLET